LGLGSLNKQTGFDFLGFTDHKNLLVVMFLDNKSSGHRGPPTKQCFSSSSHLQQKVDVCTDQTKL